MVEPLSYSAQVTMESVAKLLLSQSNIELFLITCLGYAGGKIGIAGMPSLTG